ncbi:MAG: hypothetical protein NT105_23950 [Verrucomicrobia bacterium]|nr:hypothetical protein [Verrucomicrobiota bacterium]
MAGQLPTTSRLSLTDNIITVGRKSALSFCRPDIATMESGESGAEWSGGEAE